MKGMQLLRRMMRRSFSEYSPSIEVLISKSAILHNLQAYRRTYPNAMIAPVLKSNAYGHGIVGVAEILDKEPIAFFMVDSLYEAALLRSEGMRSPIVVMGYVRSRNIASCNLSKVSFVLTDIEQIQEISRTLSAEKSFHLKIDTGMHRQGILPDQLAAAIAAINASPHMKIDGICSHFADSDNPDDSFLRKQSVLWESCVDICRKSFPSARFFHLSNTAAARYAHEETNNVIRLGRGLYGIDTSPDPSKKMDLRLVLRMRSWVSSLKTIPAGEKIGYGGTYETSKPTRVALIPVGYFEGIDRRLSNIGSVLIDVLECPIIGRVSMNMASIDVTAVQHIEVGDEVTVISDDPRHANSVVRMAQLADTIPHEILIHIPQHLRRSIVS